MKKLHTVLALLLCLCLLSARGGNQTPAETGEAAGAFGEEYLVATTPAPRIEPSTDIEPRRGASLYSLRQQLNGHLIAESFFHLAWENKSDYVVAVAKNGSMVSGYARFSKDGELLEENGLRTIRDFAPDEWAGRPFDEFVAAFGPEHCDAGSGLYIPSYLSDTGKIYYLTVDTLDKKTIARISTLDLADQMAAEPVLTDENGKIPVLADERNRLAAKNEMLAFFLEHREEMEDFAGKLKALNDSDPDYHYQYAAEENALYGYDGESIRAKVCVTEHPVLADAAFFGDKAPFLGVYQSDHLFECDACFFWRYVHTVEGQIYAELSLFYTEDEPVTDEYMIVEPLGDNWYFYCEYKE